MMCYNCDKKGHISCFCKELKKSKDKDNSGKGKQSDRKGSGSGTANVVESSKETEEDGAWAVVEELDWFEEAIEEMEGIGWANTVEELNDTSGEAFVTKSTKTHCVTKLYDSGCTNHISPYCAKLKNFTNITPRMFCAANKQTFSTIGKGVTYRADTDHIRLASVSDAFG